MSGLPYDRTPSPQPEAPGPAAGAEAGLTEPSALDMALDDYVPAGQPVSEEVQSLMGRMSKGKVYLLDESPAIVLVDGKERIRGDPRIASLAAQLDQHDPTEWLMAASTEGPAPIRPNALFVRSDNIKHMSTSKVFTWSTGLGADILGIEWLNDETLLLIFRDAPAALLGLSLIAKVGFDPAEGDDPLLERSAHSIPISLLPQAPPDPALSKAGEELLGAGTTSEESAGGVRKRGRGNFSDTGGRFDLPALASDVTDDFGLLPGVDPHARIVVRYATVEDSQLRRDAKQSEWYQRHGRSAGKERANAPRGFEREREDNLSWSGRGAGEGKDFARRIGRERAQPYARPPRDDRDRDRARGAGRAGRRTADDLDQELERMAQRRATGGADEGPMDVDMDVDMETRERDDRGYRGDRGERRPRGQRRERRGREDLDKGAQATSSHSIHRANTDAAELDDMFASRGQPA